MNRGSDHAAVDGLGRRARFNEAPIHESGKFGSAARSEVHEPVLQ